VRLQQTFLSAATVGSQACLHHAINDKQNPAPLTGPYWLDMVRIHLQDKSVKTCFSDGIISTMKSAISPARHSRNQYQ
jgi:hypothetical protein